MPVSFANNICQLLSALLKRVSWPNKKSLLGIEVHIHKPRLLVQHIDMCVMWANKSLVEQAQLFVDITRSPIAALIFKIVFLHKYWVELRHPKRVISASLHCSLNNFQLLFQHFKP